MNSLFSKFSEAIHSAGLQPPAEITPGKLHRFPGSGKSIHNTAGWCLLFDDMQAGCYGDWSAGWSKTWQGHRAHPLTKAERQEFAQRIRLARLKAISERSLINMNAAKRAMTIWTKAMLAGNDHPYLKRKNIRTHGAKLSKTLQLILPIIDFQDHLTSLQFITADGTKRLLSGGQKQGCYIPVSKNKLEPERVLICEGWATGCTLAENEPNSTVLAAIDAGNLKAVAIAARNRWQSAELVIAGDNDRLTAGNPGASKAKDAAIAAGALLALPEWSEDAPFHLTDFNDLALWLAGGWI